MIWKRKEDYYCLLSNKLNDPPTCAKLYSSILKTLYNGKKIPLIPFILIKNNFISNFKEKKKKKTTLWPLFVDGVQLPQG